MRTLANISHPLMRISVTSWNDKYQLRFELDRYEQVFKISHDETSGLPSIEKFAARISDDVLRQFVEMRKTFQSQHDPS